MLFSDEEISQVRDRDRLRAVLGTYNMFAGNLNLLMMINETKKLRPPKDTFRAPIECIYKLVPTYLPLTRKVCNKKKRETLKQLDFWM